MMSKMIERRSDLLGHQVCDMTDSVVMLTCF